MTKDKIIYWISTGLLCAVFAFSATMYLLNHDLVAGFFESLGFPTWLVYPLAILKIIAILAILTKKSTFLKELAYAGFMFDAILALTAHLIADDGGFTAATIAIVMGTISWIYDRKVYGKYTQSLMASMK